MKAYTHILFSHTPCKRQCAICLMAGNNESTQYCILRSRSSDVCSSLSNSEESLLRFAGKLYDKELIDIGTKADVRRKKGYEGADIMMDYLLTKLKDSPALFTSVINIMKEVELLKTIATDIETAARKNGLSVCTSTTNTDGISSSGASATVGKKTRSVRYAVCYCILFLFAVNKVAPSKVLRKHMSDILDLVSDPNRLATDMYNNELISRSVQDEVHTTLGLSRYIKASKIVNDFQRQLNVFDDAESLKKFCEVLKSQGDPKLERKAKEMLYDL